VDYVNVGYNSTNYYAIGSQNKYILIDVGMPGTMKKLIHSLNKAGIDLKDIKYIICTHFHPDHCGIVEDLQELGVELVISRIQKTFLDSANKFLKKISGFKEITVNPNNIIVENDPNIFLRKFGLKGYIIHTPGHSEDSISIVIEGLGVFIGDLPLLGNNGIERREVVKQSWDSIKNTREKTIFPAHQVRFQL
jgi:glyoxylase-like metal-dependent hydrolase (beta-lactamase superfamily II)